MDDNQPAGLDISEEVARAFAEGKVDLVPAMLTAFKNISVVSQFNAALTSSQFLLKNAAELPFYPHRNDVLDDALSKVDHSDGVFAEFGVFTGAVTWYICGKHPEREYHAFDSWEGLPEGMSLAAHKTSFDLAGTIPDLPANAIPHKGWFDDTAPGWSRDLKKHVDFAYIDCDLYSSTNTTLEALRPHIRPGTVLAFDDWYNFPGWRDHGAKSFKEFIEQTGFKFEMLSFSTLHHAAAFKCTALSGGTVPYVLD